MVMVFIFFFQAEDGIRDVAVTGVQTCALPIFSLEPRERRTNFSDVAELTLLSPGDILFLYTDGVYDGSDKEERQQLENVIRDHQALSAKDICNALLEYAVKKDDHLRQISEQDRIDDKTVFIIKRN